MKRNIIKVLVFMCMVCLCGLLCYGKTSAASRAIAISPTNERIVLMPGETFRGGFNVVNPNDAEGDLHFAVSLAPFNEYKGANSKDDYGEVDLSGRTSWNQIMDWTTLANETGTVVPNSEETVEFIINVPEDAPAGGQYMAILVRENPDYAEQNENSLGIKESMQMAFVVFAEVAGETREEAEILENNVPSFMLNSSLVATSRVKNNGNVHTNAEYILQVWPIFSDEEICTNEEDVGSSFVLPETERYHTESCELPKIGIFRARQMVEIFGEASVVEKIVIVCPIWLLFTIIFAIAAIIIYFFARAKARKSKKRVSAE